VLFLDGQSPVPAYRQIVEQVIFLVRTGRLEPGAGLPASRQLARQLQVNRNTTARAYAELSRRGYAQAEQGRAGLFVQRSLTEQYSSSAYRHAAAVLSGPTRECVDVGLTAVQIRRIAWTSADVQG